jgi:hypothetical protein
MTPGLFLFSDDPWSLPNQGTDRLGRFFEKIPSVVLIAVWPIRLMAESLAAAKAEQIQKGSL